MSKRSIPDKLTIEAQLIQVFTPSAPIDRSTLFAGRTDQLRRVIDTIKQRGQHAIVFGERGVGKTSLVNILEDIFKRAGESIIAAHVFCDGTDNYSTVWRKVFAQIGTTVELRRAGFTNTTTQTLQSVSTNLPEQITPDLVRQQLTQLGNQILLIIIIDEFDRLPNGNISRLFADTIKVLSDQSVPATIILVGVADNVDDLIKEHESTLRALVQIRMPRMSQEELAEIIRKGLNVVGMKIEAKALDYITLLSQGLPNYTHLLGLASAREALDHNELKITFDHVTQAINKAINNIQQSMMSSYHRAVASTRKSNLYAQVLLACALAKTDDLGYFAASDVRGPLSTIMGKAYDIPTFSRHLNEFCLPTRGPILQKKGDKHRFRFRFINPLLQPFVIMKGFASGLIERMP